MDEPNFFRSGVDETTAVWQSAYSLGQIYNKGLFLLSYYTEVNECARAILEQRAPVKGTLQDAWHVTRLFEGFAQGPGKVITL